MKIWKGIGIVACVAGVVFLIYSGKDGWGWLVFVAVLLAFD